MYFPGQWLSEMHFHGQKVTIRQSLKVWSAFPFQAWSRKHTLNPAEVNYRANIRAMKKLWVTHIIATTCCGSLKKDMKPGDFVILDSFVDRSVSVIQYQRHTDCDNQIRENVPFSKMTLSLTHKIGHFDDAYSAYLTPSCSLVDLV